MKKKRFTSTALTILSTATLISTAPFAAAQNDAPPSIRERAAHGEPKKAHLKSPRNSAGSIFHGASLAGSGRSAPMGIDTSVLRKIVTVKGIKSHLKEFEVIANTNEGYRMAGMPGYDKSADYVARKLGDAGYIITRQEFDFPYFKELREPVLELVSSAVTTHSYDPAEFMTMYYSGSGDITGTVQPVDVMIPPGEVANTSTSGCEEADFASFVPGNIALIQRGACAFSVKALNAEAAGAAGVILFNEGQEKRTDAFAGTLGMLGITIPVISASYALGEELCTLSAAGTTSVHMMVDAVAETRRTLNVIAETPGGRGDGIIVVGAHLDSVEEGPGTNDNGSGAATILEIARKMAGMNVGLTNKMRFAFWGAEEEGLFGSVHYVSEAINTGDIQNIALNLNFDMLASNNYALFVYDGDGSDSTPDDAGPAGSNVIENIFVSYFGAMNLPTYPATLDGRSDYLAFALAGIPVGGLFAGADGIKTDQQVLAYGGVAGEPFDANYHTPNDTLANLDLTALDLMADAAAHAIWTVAMTPLPLSYAAQTAPEGIQRALHATEFRGPRAQR